MNWKDQLLNNKITLWLQARVTWLKARVTWYALALALFWAASLLWAIIWVALVWPTGGTVYEYIFILNETQTERQTVSILAPERLYVHADEPERIILQFSSFPNNPITTTLRFPGEILITEVVPSDAIISTTISQTTQSIAVRWPSFPEISGNSDAITSTLSNNISEFQQDISLGIKNAHTITGDLFHNYVSTTLQVCINNKSVSEIPIEIETIAHARWRVFAEKYSFLAFAPLLMTLISGMWKLYTDHRQRQIDISRHYLERFKQTIIQNGDQDHTEELDHIYGKLTALAKYLDETEKTLLDTAYSLLKTECPDAGRDISSKTSFLDETFILRLFHEWPDTSASILKALFRQFSEECGESILFHRYLRLFPREKLSVDAISRFQSLINDIKLPQIQGIHNWPSMPSAPKEKKLFFSDMADDHLEQQLLFSDKSCLYSVGSLQQITAKFTEEFVQTSWGQIYSEIDGYQKSSVWIIRGEPGTGKTTLALGFGRYKQAALGCYTSTSDILHIQTLLARRMLDFANERATRLAYLDYDDRALLGRLWVSRLDRQYLIARLNLVQPANQDETDKKSEIHEQQAMVERRLIRSAIQRMPRNIQLANENWFLGFAYLAKKLKFESIYIAVDLSKRVDISLLSDFATQIQQVDDILIKLIITVSDFSGLSRQISNLRKPLRMYEIQWDKESLEAMLQHRIEQTELQMPDDKISEWLDDANSNPARLARNYLTFESIQQANESKNKG